MQKKNFLKRYKFKGVKKEPNSVKQKQLKISIQCRYRNSAEPFNLIQLMRTIKKHLIQPYQFCACVFLF